MHQDVEKILVTEEEITERCKELGRQITQDYAGKKAPILVSILKGAAPFMTEISKRIDLDVELEFMCVSSYAGTGSTGNIKIIMDLQRDIAGENILLVEDIVDTGITLSKVKKMLLDRGANEVKIVTMLDKKERRVTEIQADYVAFNVPNEFVIGFGLDYNQKYRNLPFIGVLKEDCYK